MDNSDTTSGVKFPPPLIYAVFFVIGLLLQRIYPRELAIPPDARFSVGGFLLVLGSGILAWSMILFFRAKTSPLPMVPTTALVIAGPYQYTRNPMYVSLLLLYLGVALWFALFWPLVLSPLVVPLVNVLVISREEKYLETKFGEEYRQYRSEVPRWL